MGDDQKQLEEERRRTQEETARLRSYLETEMTAAGVQAEGGVDFAAEVHEREKTLTLIRTLEAKLAAIDQALHSQAVGEYGICQRCKEAIDQERLEVMPYATLCVRCQSEAERSGRRRPEPQPELG